MRALPPPPPPRPRCVFKKVVGTQSDSSVLGIYSLASTTQWRIQGGGVQF